MRRSVVIAGVFTVASSGCAVGGDDVVSVTQRFDEPRDGAVLLDTGRPDTGVDLGTPGDGGSDLGVDLGPSDTGVDVGPDPCAVPDEPDDAFADSNCDGVDGDAAALVFVATNGDDTAGNGSRTAPYRTVGRALTVAESTGRDVAVSAGTYREHVVIPSGVSLYGGYARAAGWARSASNLVTLEQQRTDVLPGGYLETVLVDAPLAPVVLDRVRVVAGDPVLAPSAIAANVYGVRVFDGAAMVTLRHVTVIAGRGASGQAGPMGSMGASGGDGGAGATGNPSASPNRTGGTAGTNPSCAITNGGRGGDGGSWATCGATSSGQGGAQPTAVNNCTVGGGGAGANCGDYNADDGGPGNVCGTPPANGMPASGATTRGTVVSGLWQGTSGGTGPQGGHGVGGSGGGGGGGSSTFSSPANWHGGGGGGGGAGGCGGLGGGGGTSGGSSFALFVVDADVTLEACDLTAGNGGFGGFGGPGGPGGSFGRGGAGGSSDGSGGRGGDGQSGATGGLGGGGAGGVSVALYVCGGSSAASGTTFAVGTAGSGGSAQGGVPANGGIAGTAVAQVTLPAGSCSTF